MYEFAPLYDTVYNLGQIAAVTGPLPANPLTDVAHGVRPLSIAVEGGAFGDEGKGRVVDEVSRLLMSARRTGIVYRWNGGANAGHTVVVDGYRLALHQLHGVEGPEDHHQAHDGQAQRTAFRQVLRDKGERRRPEESDADGEDRGGHEDDIAGGERQELQA